MKIIGCAGQMQAGKDTLCNYLADKLNALEPDLQKSWQRTSLASSVKKVYCETFERDLEFVENWKVKDECPPGFDQNVRKSLQFIGDGFRQIKSSIWVDLIFRNTLPQIISDVRYVNEFLRIKKECGINIIIGRTEKLNNDPSGSEAQIRPYVEWSLKVFEGKDFGNFDDLDGPTWMTSPPGAGDLDVFVRNDGTIEELYETIDKFLVPYVQKYFQEKECLI